MTVNEDDKQTLTFRDAALQNLVINKYEDGTNKPLAGVTFLVADTNGGRIGAGEYVTDQNGQIVIPGLTPGMTVVVREVRTVRGYVLNGNPQTITIGNGGATVSAGSGASSGTASGSGAVSSGTTGTAGTGTAGTGNTLNFYDEPLSVLLIHKYIEGTDNEPLAGVEFRLTDSSGAEVGNGTYYTDNTGEIRVENLVPGTDITIRETKTVDGYLLDGTPKTVKIPSGDVKEAVFWNARQGQLQIKKMDAATKEPIADVTFKVTRADGSVVGAANGEYRTDATGIITIRDLKPDTYVVREVKARDGYLLDDTARTIEIKDGKTYTVEFFNEKLGGLVIHKLDSVTKEPLSGVQFKLAYADGSFVDKGNQGSNGLYTTDKDGQISIPGISGTVVITEQQTIDGYRIDPATCTQTVEVKPGSTQTVTVYNDPYGGVEIIKVNADNRSVRLPNTTFEIHKVDGGVVKTVTTGQYGRVFAALDAGSYYAVEIEAAKGYKLDPTPQYFEVKDGQTTPLTITNKAFSGILIHKTDSVTGKGIYDVSFLLYDASKKPLGQYESDQNGNVYIDDLPESGKYYLRELENPGYVVDTELKTVYVEAGKTIEINWKNQPITGQIQLYKYAAEENAVTGTAAGAPLSGAVYEIVNVRTGQVVDQITTDARGVAASNPLPLGRYQLKEVTAPAYWQIDSTVHDVTLEYAGQIIKVSAFDKPAQLGVVITKTGNKEVLAGDRMVYRFTVGNTSNVALSSFFWHDKLPYDVSTGYAVTTGVYSARLNYRVLYKTNYNDYRVLASNLLSTNNYALPLSALPLQEGEVVTDIQFEFGKVPAGFHTTTQPTLTVSVSAKAVNGYSMTNRADAGGKYGETWETATAGWTTIVRRLTPNKPLPKTGY